MAVGPRNKKSAALFWICVATLILTILMAITDAWFRIAHRPFLILGDPDRDFWLVWEVSAILSAIVGTSAYWLVQYLVPPKIYRLVSRDWVTGTSPFVIAATLWLFWSAAQEALDHEHGHLCKQLGFLCGGVLGFVLVQGMFLWDTGNPTGDAKDKNADNLRQAREDLRGAMIYSDTPALIAFMTLLGFVSILLTDANHNTLLRAFVGGVVAFELVTTNVVFVFEFWHTPTCLISKFPKLHAWLERVLKPN